MQTEQSIRPAASPRPELQIDSVNSGLINWDPITVRDESGRAYTFFHEGTHLSFVEGDDADTAPESRIRIERFTYPRGRFQCFLYGLRGKSDFKFVDEHEKEWHLRATEGIHRLMNWDMARHAPRARVLEVLPLKLKEALENAESTGRTFDLLILAELVATDTQNAPWGDESTAIVALSDEDVLIATQVEDVSAEFPGSSIKLPLAQMKLDVVLDLPEEDVSSGAIACAKGKRLGSRGELAVCRLKTDRGQVIFLALTVGDLQAVKRRIASNSTSLGRSGTTPRTSVMTESHERRAGRDMNPVQAPGPESESAAKYVFCFLWLAYGAFLAVISWDMPLTLLAEGHNRALIAFTTLASVFSLSGVFLYAFKFQPAAVRNIWKYVFPILIVDEIAGLFWGDPIEMSGWVDWVVTAAVVLPLIFPLYYANFRLAYKDIRQAGRKGKVQRSVAPEPSRRPSEADTISTAKTGDSMSPSGIVPDTVGDTAPGVQGSATSPDHEADEDHRVTLFTEALQRRRPVATLSIAAVIAVVFFVEILSGGSNYIPTVVRSGALSFETLAELELWRLFSSMFVHFGFAHVGFAIVVLWALGSFLERLLGTARFLCLFLLSGLCGSVLALVFNPFMVTAGASGALWGLMVAQGILVWKPMGLIPAALLPQARKSTRNYLILNALISFLPSVSLWGHLGGAVAGVLLVGTGLLLVNVRPWDDKRPEGRGRLAAFAIPAAILAVVCLFSVGRALQIGQPWSLNDPLVLETRTIEPWGLTLEVPSSLRSTYGWIGEDMFGEISAGLPLSFGHITRDHLQLSVEVEAWVYDRLGANSSEELLTHWRTSFDREGWVAERTADRIDQDAGYPSAHEIFIAPNGIRLDRHLLVYRIPDSDAEQPSLAVKIDVASWNQGDREQHIYRVKIPQYLSESELDVTARRNRAFFFAVTGFYVAARYDYERAIEQDPSDWVVVNDLAWMLAVSPEPSVRDGTRSRDLAHRALELADTSDKRATVLDTLAAAHAELGDFESAARTQQEAILLVGEENAGYQERLQLYLQGRAYRDEG